MKAIKIFITVAAFGLAVACNSGGSESTTPESSGGEGGVDITRVPGMDSSVFATDSAGAGLDSNNLQR